MDTSWIQRTHPAHIKMKNNFWSTSIKSLNFHLECHKVNVTNNLLCIIDLLLLLFISQKFQFNVVKDVDFIAANEKYIFFTFLFYYSTKSYKSFNGSILIFLHFLFLLSSFYYHFPFMHLQWHYTGGPGEPHDLVLVVRICCVVLVNDA